MRNSYKLHTIRNKLLDIFAPGPYHCFSCDNEATLDEHGLCSACAQQVLLCPSPTWLPPLDGLSVGLQYTEPVQKAVLLLKRQRRYEYAPFLVQYMTIPEEWHADILIPVPMHPFSEWKRGFHQSALLAQYLSAKYGIPYTRELLLKKRYTMQQKQLSGDARRKNVRNSFYAEPECKGLRMVLVDDVFTTGATLYECAKTLKQRGAERVYACCASSPVR